MATYTLYNRQDYFEHLIQRCNAAKKDDTILLATMEFRPDQPAVSDIVSALCNAASQGAHVSFIIDSYSLMLKEGSIPGPLYFGNKDPKYGYGAFKSIVDAIRQLKDAGVNCEVVNKPKRAFKNPFSGRSHIKYAVINDEVLIGGCNLSHPEQLDVMVQLYSQKLADHLAAFTSDVIREKSVYKALQKQDRTFKIDAETQLLIDAGVRKQSVIYENALKLIQGASKRVYMTCQYFPNTSTPAALAAAHDRGVGVHLAYNHPDQHRTPIKGAQKRTVAFKRKRLPESVFANQLDMDRNYLHAKILLSEKEAIIGSHNFVELGVRFGTAEMAIKSTAPEFIAAAKQWIKEL